MWSSARYDLGLSEREFWKLTPRALQWLGRRHREKLLRQEGSVGLLCSLLVNFSMRAPKRWAKPADFMPSENRKQRRESDAKPEEIAANIREAMNALVG